MLICSHGRTAEEPSDHAMVMARNGDVLRPPQPPPPGVPRARGEGGVERPPRAEAGVVGVEAAN